MIGNLLLCLVVSAIFCHFIAKKRGADTLFWCVMGLALGPLAIPFVFFSKPPRPKAPKA